MAESSWPTVAGSRVVNDDQWELMTSGFAPDGIIGAPTDTTVVYGDSTGRQVKVRASKLAIVAGAGWSSGTSDFTLSIAANSSGSTRTDTIVLRRSRTTWAVTATIIQGTPGAGAPALVRNAKGSSAGSWDIPLATVTVVNGAVTIAAGDVTNCAWYVRSGGVSTSSTNFYQPPVADYSTLWHHDTGNRWIAVSGAWRVDGFWRTTQVLAVAAATITFSSIPAYFRNLRLTLLARGDAAAQQYVNVKMRFNNDSGTNYDHEQIYGAAATAGAGEGLADTGLLLGDMPGPTVISGSVAAFTVDIPFYADATFWTATISEKTLMSQTSGGQAGQLWRKSFSGRWRNTAAVNRIDLITSAGNFIAGSSAELMGQP